MLDTGDIIKRWRETGSAFPDPALFQFRKGICYRDHFPVANLQYRETFRRISGKFSAFYGHLRRYRKSLGLFMTFFLSFEALSGKFTTVYGFFRSLEALSGKFTTVYGIFLVILDDIGKFRRVYGFF